MRRPPIYSAVFSLPAAFALSLFMWGCGTDGRAAWLDLEPGDPIPGLSDEQRESFERGLALFSRVHTPEDGLGPIFEAIPDSTILAMEDPDDLNRDGIAGRAPLDPEGRVARFARKGLATTLSELVEASVRLDLGLTTPDHPEELGPNRAPLPAGIDRVPNPELTREELEDWTAFVRFLALLP